MGRNRRQTRPDICRILCPTPPTRLPPSPVGPDDHCLPGSCGSRGRRYCLLDLQEDPKDKNTQSRTPCLRALFVDVCPVLLFCKKSYLTCESKLQEYSTGLSQSALRLAHARERPEEAHFEFFSAICR